MADSSSNNPLFDPFNQEITLLLPDGQTPLNISLSDLDDFVLLHSQICINYGTQIGATIVMLLVVLLATRKSKRSGVIYLVNVFSLLLCFIRNVLLVIYWIGPWSETYAWFAGDFDHVTQSATATSVATPIISMLVLIFVEISLLLQTNVVCVTMRKKLHYGLLGFSILLVLSALATRFAAMVYNIEVILDLTDNYNIDTLTSASLILSTCTVWYFSIIFMGKLGWTLYQRKRMGLKQWGPMQIICIMSGCTMIIPSIFAILEYYPDCFPEAGSLGLTMVTIFLPLSSLWAAASVDTPDPLHPRSSRQAATLNSSVPMLQQCANCRKTSVCLSPYSIDTERSRSRTKDAELDEEYGPSGFRVERTIATQINYGSGYDADLKKSSI